MVPNQNRNFSDLSVSRQNFWEVFCVSTGQLPVVVTNVLYFVDDFYPLDIVSIGLGTGASHATNIIVYFMYMYE